MFKLFLKGIAVLLCFGTLVVAVNFKVDKYGFFQGEVFERNVVRALMDGNAVAYDELTINEREVTRIYIENMQKKDTVVIGSSRGMQITKDFASNPDSFFNFSVNAADIRDVMNTYYYLYKNNKVPKDIILIVEPWFFYSDAKAFTPRANIKHYNEFLATVLEFDVQYEKPDYSTMLETVISPSVFQENITYFFRDKSTERRVELIDNPYKYSGSSAMRLPDGTQLYQKSFREREQDLVYEESIGLVLYDFYRLEGMKKIDENLMCQFEAFVNQMQKDNVNITFVLMPYHPITYALAVGEAKRFPAFFKVESYLLNIAKDNNIPVYGSYDPNIVGCSEYDFYDGMHIRRESVNKVFSGLEGSEAYNQLEADEEMVYPRNK